MSKDLQSLFCQKRPLGTQRSKGFQCLVLSRKLISYQLTVEMSILLEAEHKPEQYIVVGGLCRKKKEFRTRNKNGDEEDLKKKAVV